MNLTSTNVVGLATGDTIPSGAVMAFNLASCPIGWSEANGTSGNPDLRGEFIRGLDNGRGVDSGRVLASWQVDEFKSHNHNARGSGLQNGGTSGAYGDGGSLVSGTSFSGGTETRPRNVALLYCVKD